MVNHTEDAARTSPLCRNVMILHDFPVAGCYLLQTVNTIPQEAIPDE
jgi:hypothetical protein